MKAGTRNNLIAAIWLTLAASVVAGNDHANGVLSISTEKMTEAGPQGAGAAKKFPNGWFAILPDKIPWSKQQDGREFAYPLGEWSKPGLYIQIVRWPPNSSAKAHSHPDDRYGFVISGTFYHGYGNKFDVKRLEVRPAGTFFTEPAGIAHYGATKDDGAVLYFVGTGPSKINQIEK